MTATHACHIQHRWRVVLSTIIFIVGLWAYLAVVEIRNPDRSVAFLGDSATAMIWPSRPHNKPEEQVAAIKKLP